MRKFFSNFITLFTFLTISIFFGIITYCLHHNINPTKRLIKQVSCNGQVLHAYFSPEDNIKRKLIKFIEHEKESMSIAIYTITDKEIAQSIIKAYSKGIKVEMITDKSYGAGTYSKIPMLANKRIPIWVYQTPEDLAGNNNNKQYALMHNKFIIFGKNINNKSLLFTGSFNFTKSANQFNQESVIVTDNSKIIARFKNNFEKIKSKSLLISGSSKAKICYYQRPEASWFDWLLNGEWLKVLD